MRLARFIPVALLVFPTASFAQGWLEYIDKSNYFSVNFPAEPDVREVTHLSSQGLAFPALLYSARGVRGDAYSVTVVDYTDAERIHAERPDKAEDTSLRSWFWDVRSSVGHIAWNIRKRGGEVTFDGWSDIERVEGHQLQITNTDESRTFVGIYLHGLRLYVLEATVPPGSPPPGLFQQSLRFFDEEGIRVRYDIAVNGNITRIPGSYEYVGGSAEIIERVVE